MRVIRVIGIIPARIVVMRISIRHSPTIIRVHVAITYTPAWTTIIISAGITTTVKSTNSGFIVLFSIIIVDISIIHFIIWFKAIDHWKRISKRLYFGKLTNNRCTGNSLLRGCLIVFYAIDLFLQLLDSSFLGSQFSFNFR